jgi:hypothetical protein
MSESNADQIAQVETIDPRLEQAVVAYVRSRTIEYARKEPGLIAASVPRRIERDWPSEFAYIKSLLRPYSWARDATSWWCHGELDRYLTKALNDLTEMEIHEHWCCGALHVFPGPCDLKCFGGTWVEWHDKNCGNRTICDSRA